LQTNIPWIVTLHGAANLSMPLRDTFGTSFINKLKGFFVNTRRRLMWKIYKHSVAHIITVSNFAKEEIIQQLNLESNQISVIYHGYDDTLFYRQSGAKSYLFHVSMYQPKKNVEKIIEAYQLIKDENKLPLIITCPNYPNKISDEKIQLITTKTESKQISKYLKEAYCFIFPSTHESFGMPLLEAMACGVPVITSNTTACKEITKDAAILVDPNSTEEIKNAMQLLMNDIALHDSFSKKSLETASSYSWEKAGFLHAEIFKRYAKQ
ncbi:MAG TPA: glycosyltransferase family 1 protein, partial [Chitinophagales bacterium]|nr:glycosyltransferase family 1 protein [Chitinophagales bacterium]